MGHPFPFSFHFYVQSVSLQPLESGTPARRGSVRPGDKSHVPSPAARLGAGDAQDAPRARLLAPQQRGGEKNRGSNILKV